MEGDLGLEVPGCRHGSATNIYSPHVVAKRGYGRSSGRIGPIERTLRSRKMNFCKLEGARDDREIARVPLRKAIDFGKDLIENPKDEKGQFRFEAIQYGVEKLEYASDEYGSAHSEVK